jgi:hypothetical protein
VLRVGGRCSEYDVVEVVKEANKNEEVLMAIKDVIKKLKGRGNCRDYRDRTLYAKVERALERKLIIFDPHRGYIAVDPKHAELILKVCRLILCNGVTCEVLRDELGLQYKTLDEMIELVEMALQHIITSQKEEVRESIREFITAQGREWYRLVDLVKVFYLRSKERGSIDGWCKRCSGKPSDRELETVLKRFIMTSYYIMEKLGVPTIRSY